MAARFTFVALIIAPQAPDAAPAITSAMSSAAVVTTSGAPANKLDTAYIHKTYLEGEFDLAIELIGDAMKYGGPFSHQDSIFIFKHLGVMHAAKYETRELGKRYMLALLEVEPTAKILDMYASDMIYMIFKNIKDEFDSRNPRLSNHSADGSVQRGDKASSKRKSNYTWIGWTAGAIAVIGGVALAVHMVEEGEPKKDRENTSNE